MIQSKLRTVEQNSHAFILRIWLEPREEWGAESVWRGMILHVSSGEKMYFIRLESVQRYLADYIEQIIVEQENSIDTGL